MLLLKYFKTAELCVSWFFVVLVISIWEKLTIKYSIFRCLIISDNSIQPEDINPPEVEIKPDSPAVLNTGKPIGLRYDLGVLHEKPGQKKNLLQKQLDAINAKALEAPLQVLIGKFC